MNVVDALNGLWNTILDITEMFVIPDWSAVIALIPLLIFLGVVGPLLTFTVLGILVYQVAKPRAKLSVEEGPQVARSGADGQPIFPPGHPFCRTHGLIYPTGTTRCDRGGEALSVICPMCGLGRPAAIDTCPNCGLVLNVKARPVPLGSKVGTSREAPRWLEAGRNFRRAPIVHAEIAMAELSSILFPIGVVLVALAFAAHVGHAVMLANGRRVALPALGTAQRPAYAGVVTGSFVTNGSRGSAGASAVVAASPSPLSRVATWLTLAAAAVLGTSLLLRGIVVGRGPWGNMFEFTVAFATSMVAGFALLARRYPIRSIGFLPLGVALALLLYASSLPREISQLVPALQNPPLLTIHVGMAVLSYGIFATSFAAGVAYLVQGQHDRFTWLPPHKVLDEVAYRAVIIGFPIFATMIILGSWWASIAWSRYWGWDPKETAALVTWLIYAVYLHARNQRSWAGRPAALLLVVGFVMVLITYSGSLWFSGLHSYSGL